ncbi:MAG: PhzF family phenazine biosynthesis isomerase [Phenylobacterium sp.]|nr:PhzF family phenazine biosynthesis isomerase [Phenylobacterium sp.]MDP3746740.1 PhzF family phenazine biosynthesis isomerase [Phenylobacterium sp.]
MRMYQVDAFSDRLFSGNPAAVLVLDDRLPDDLMLAIAQENNLAETAFVKARPDGAWDLRWFAPAHDVNFCGHTTLATAHVLLTKVKAEPPFVFHTRVGELRVSKGPGGYRLDIPRLPPEAMDAPPPEIAGIFSAPPAHKQRVRSHAPRPLYGRAMLDEAVVSAKTGGASEDPKCARDCHRMFAAATDLVREHACEGSHLTRRDLMPRVQLQFGIVHRCDDRLLFEKSHYGQPSRPPSRGTGTRDRRNAKCIQAVDRVFTLDVQSE